MFFKKKEIKSDNFLTKVCALLIHAAKIDENYSNKEAKIIKQTKADVLPVYFDGKNGLLYHLFASKLKNQTLKYSSYHQ